MNRAQPGPLARTAFVICGLFSRDRETRSMAIFITFDAVPRWARRGPYLWAARRLMYRWHGPQPPNNPPL